MDERQARQPPAARRGAKPAPRERPSGVPATGEPRPAGGAFGAYDAGGATDRGQHRSNNEDAFAVAPLTGRDGLLLVVADGLGGTHGGEVASRTAVDTILADLAGRPLPADRTLRLALRRAVERAGEALDELARQEPELAEFGTTVTAALIAGSEMWVAHVGDSRAYLWRGGRLEQLTRDHTLAERLREEGLVEARQRLPNFESVLWNALGPSGEETQVEERHERLQPGDRLLLCSDGLTRHLEDDELLR
ncbi:MAG TPA: protein phosphatase 2C domain-containing protein [Thermoanaerobaculia bacterium]|jgi:protein phosphatase|nr:protein phosphatase 2C domain-containing protein [Thermoanaerobaculia bacterium]